MFSAEDAIAVMKHEEDLKEVYSRLPFLRIVAEN
jgi:hypothetical protein